MAFLIFLLILSGNCVDFSSTMLFEVLGKMSAEGKIKNKFDMRPHSENIESYGKLCRERTSKYMCRNRQIQVLVKTV